MEFAVEVAEGFRPAVDTALVLERPDRARVVVNGREVLWVDAGYYRDRSFRMTPIGAHLGPGANTIAITTTFRQPPEVYERPPGGCSRRKEQTDVRLGDRGHLPR